LTNKFNYKAENERLSKFLKSAEKWNFCGGPLTKEVLDQYPGAVAYIQHLRERFGLEYRIYRPPSIPQANSGSSNIPLIFQTRKSASQKQKGTGSPETKDKRLNEQSSTKVASKEDKDAKDHQNSNVTISKIPGQGAANLASNSDRNFRI
jgi:hypothetical protein